MFGAGSIINQFGKELEPTVPAVYFVSLSGDNSDGLTEATAFNTVQAAVNAATTNDIIGLNGGDTFYESVLISGKGGIILTSYGTGQAELNGTKAVAGWTVHS